jgi:hypothetical protein
MFRLFNTRQLATVPILILALSLFAFAQEKSQGQKEIPSGTPVLWREPRNITSRNLYLGPGGVSMKPDLRHLTLIKQEKGGYSTKYRVRDASGREWVAKIGKEAQAETAAVRLVWAAGYVTEINYLAPSVRIEGLNKRFQNVRLEARPKNVKRDSNWKWDDNPFIGTREFQGLKIMMALLNNWDIKDSNNVILLARNPRTGVREMPYAISDLGATFGKSSRVPIFWRITRSRNNPKDYVKADFVDEIKDGRVYFHYAGRRNSIFKDITVEDAQWLGRWLTLLSNRQIRDAFRAANYSPIEVDMLTGEVKERIGELMNLPSGEMVGRQK